MRRVCFYHAGCPDGFGAAWAVWKAWGEKGEYRPCSHDDEIRPAEFEGAQVLFVDIAPPNETLLELGEHAAQLVVLDHHLSARERFEADPAVENTLRVQGHLAHFDLAHSGAVLAWRHFHPADPVPELLRYVEDVDLWRFSLPRAAAVSAAVNARPRTFQAWDELAALGADQLADEGEPIVRAQRMEVYRAVAMAHPIALGALRVEGVNAAFHRSAIGHELAKRSSYGRPWGLVYRVVGPRVDVSLYSLGELDVSKVAAEHGGGGHRNAAGFTVTLEDWLARFVV